MKKLIFSGLLSLAICGSGEAATNSLVSSNTVFSMIQQYGAGSNYIAQFMTVIQPNATTATIQAAFNQGGTIWFTPSATPYTITTNISVTNGVTVYGNNSVFKFATGLTNIMFDTGTNAPKGVLTLDSMNIDGNIYNPYGFTNTYFILASGFATPYYNPYYSNRTGMRLSVSSGVTVRNCRFYGWPGNGLILLNTNSQTAHLGIKAEITGNLFYSNFVGICLSGNYTDQQGYYLEPAKPTYNTSEYQGIRGNQMFRNYIGISKRSANGQVQNNLINDNAIGMMQSSGDNNGAHDVVQHNNFNHNQYAFWSESNNGSQLSGNSFQANTAADIIVNNVTQMQIQDNWFGSAGATLVITNGCSGFFRNNYYNGTWASWAPIITNTVIVSGNRSLSSAGNTDPYGVVSGTNYIADGWVPVAGQAKLIWSNNVLYAVTTTKTNLVTDAR